MMRFVRLNEDRDSFLNTEGVFLERVIDYYEIMMINSSKRKRVEWYKGLVPLDESKIFEICKK
jgi:hypothetical protein